MKKSLLWVVLLLMSTTLQLCTEEGETLAPEKVQFTITLPAGIDAGRIQATELPTSLLLSLETSAGVPVFTFKEINLLRVGESFITEPLELTQGSYKITDFLLVADSSRVLYATPKAGSPLAKAVSSSLPYNFYVTKNKVSNVAIEVIDVSQRLPEEFGYASFVINAVNPLRVSVFNMVDNKINLTTAKAYLLKGSDTIKSYTLGATVNLISFKGAVEDSYKLVVIKAGYNTYIKEFIYSELMAALGDQPLKIYLIQARFTMLAFVDADGTPVSNSFEFTLGTSGSHTINWGDGTSSVNETSHVYATTGNFLITVTGDLDKIQSFYSFYGQGRMDAINVQGLTELRSINFGLTHGPKVIDFTSNTKLQGISVPNVEQLERLILPAGGAVRNISISGPNQLSSSAVDEIINSIYQATVLHNEIGGSFVLFETWFPETNVMVGPPSAASITKLRELRDAYQWTISPDPL